MIRPMPEGSKIAQIFCQVLNLTKIELIPEDFQRRIAFVSIIGSCTWPTVGPRNQNEECLVFVRKGVDESLIFY